MFKCLPSQAVWCLPMGVRVYTRAYTGACAKADKVPVYPEQVKEGLYCHAALARLTTANFRLASGPVQARLRIQLSPGVAADRSLAGRFAKAIAPCVEAPLELACEEYESFRGGMGLDYERKFAYVEK